MTMEGCRWGGTGGLGLKSFGCSSLAISSELAEWKSIVAILVRDSV
jgi:hypothetical protein